MNTTAARSTRYGMGTEITYCVFGEKAEDALRAVEEEALQLESLLSCFVPESDISRINRSAGLRSERISSATFEVLAQAIEFSRHCQGLFDITIGPLVSLWNYKNSKEVPAEAKMKPLLPLVGYENLILDPRAQSAGLRKEGQSLDLGGIGKGYASDRFMETFRSFGISSAFCNIGGGVAVLGRKPDETPWSVGIRHPRQEQGLIGAVAVDGKAVVTSGDYQRYFIDRGGKRRHHILDPRTGFPAESGLISATVVADNATAADALSTILFVAGLEKGLEILRHFPGAGAVLVDTDVQVYVTADLAGSFQTTKGITASIVYGS
ncbi:MAG: thiamine biosynthesis protein ApbE [Paenibacillaceae bacterium]|jgi:thiamine biosynthesis lipoprotein|nr:thiamine biosynthesis protein ApbE [Paenibacillaceae bacterium]